MFVDQLWFFSHYKSEFMSLTASVIWGLGHICEALAKSVRRSTVRLLSGAISFVCFCFI